MKAKNKTINDRIMRLEKISDIIIFLRQERVWYKLNGAIYISLYYYTLLYCINYIQVELRQVNDSVC